MPGRSATASSTWTSTSTTVDPVGRQPAHARRGAPARLRADRVRRAAPGAGRGGSGRRPRRRAPSPRWRAGRSCPRWPPRPRSSSSTSGSRCPSPPGSSRSWTIRRTEQVRGRARACGCRRPAPRRRWTPREEEYELRARLSKAETRLDEALVRSREHHRELATARMEVEARTIELEVLRTKLTDTESDAIRARAEAEHSAHEARTLRARLDTEARRRRLLEERLSKLETELFAAERAGQEQREAQARMRAALRAGRTSPSRAGSAGTAARTPRCSRTPARPPCRRRCRPGARPPSPPPAAAGRAPGRSR